MLNTKGIGLTFLFLALFVSAASAYVYQSAVQSIDQTVKEVATFTLQSPVLGDIFEGETKSYTKAEVSELGNAIVVSTTKDIVYVHFSSNIEALGAYYSDYSVTVKFNAVPEGSMHGVGDTAYVLILGAPESSPVLLDVAGSYAFDFEITMAAKSVDSDQAASLAITLTAESS